MKSTSPVAEICLYGMVAHGSGWLAVAPELKLGTGDLRAERSMTEAVWLAAEALREAGVKKGMVRIFIPGGMRCADVDMARHVPCFGDLPWKASPPESFVTIGAEEIIAHAEVVP